MECSGTGAVTRFCASTGVTISSTFKSLSFFERNFAIPHILMQIGAYPMSLIQLIYASTPFGFDNPTLNTILSVARRNNLRDGITGSLICRADLYLQMLEGSRAAVTATFHKIMRDDRHLDVVLISCDDTKTRLFPDWHMRDDPARSWMWTQDEIADGAVDAASAEDVRAVFARIIREPSLTG